MPHLHQTRVGIRRLRSSFSLFRPLLDQVPGAFDVAHRLRTLALPLGACSRPRRAAHRPPRRRPRPRPGRPPRGRPRGGLRPGAHDPALERVGGCRARPRRAPRSRAPWPGARRPPGARARRAGAREALAPGRGPRRPTGRDGAAGAAPGAHRGQEAALRLRVLRLDVRGRHTSGRHRLGRRAHRAARLRLARRAGADRARRRSTTTPPPTGCCARSARPHRPSTSTSWSRRRSTRCAPSPPSTRSGTEPRPVPGGASGGGAPSCHHRRRSCGSGDAVEVVQRQLVEASNAIPRRPASSGSKPVSARRSARVSPSPSVGTASWSTRASRSACCTRGSARNACDLSRSTR